MRQSRQVAIFASSVLWLLACEEAPQPTDSDHHEHVATTPQASWHVTAMAAAVGGKWSLACGWQGSGSVHLHVLPNGKVKNRLHVWDPTACTATRVPTPQTNVFCGGHAFLADGRLLVTGGLLGNSAADSTGPPDANLFDYRTNTWTRVADMRAGRWYPTNTSLPNGEMLTISGLDESERSNPIPEVWRVGGGWRVLSGARRVMLNYPWMFVAPNGKVFHAGPEPTSLYLNTGGSGSWSTVAVSNYGERDDGTAVMYEPGKVLIVGGDNPPTNTAEVIDLNAGTPAWRFTGSMAFPRRHANTTLLPDGRVLVTGGTSGSNGFDDPSGAVLAAEIWDPATGRWSTMASMQAPRLYHSTAALLPDGRVLTAPGGGSQPNGLIYSPPYLFKADGSPAVRPRITSAPAHVSYGQTFKVNTPDGATIAKVSLVRISSVTHSFNQNQRFNRFTFSRVQGGVSVTTPASRNLVPPGHYLLFILNGNGVPSVGRIVQIS